MRQLLALFLGLLVLSGCSKAPEPASAPAPLTVVDAEESPEQGESPLQLFPTLDWSVSYSFDDGTKEDTEWWLRDGDRVVSANRNAVYAVWHITETGLYRRDPFDGADAPFLRFLPATLQSPIAWQQTSNGVPVSFRLRRSGVCGDTPNAPKGYCWMVEMLNRGRLMRLFFQDGKGVVAASLLDLSAPAESYHKEALSTASRGQSPVPRATWLAEADKKLTFTPAAAPPVTKLTPAEFEAAVAAALQTSTSVVSLNGPQPVYLAGRLGTPVTGAAVLISDSKAERWERLSQRLSPCTYQVQEKPVSHLVELCGKPAGSAAETKPTMSVRAWAYNQEGKLALLWWPKQTDQGVQKDGMHITLAASGDVSIQTAMGDPVRHVETTVYRLNGSFREIGSSVTRAADSQYPARPEEVLLAAFFDRWYDLPDEVPTFFATRSAAERLLRTDLRKITSLAPLKVELGSLRPVVSPKPYEAAVKLVPATTEVRKPTGFLLSARGCCDSFTNVWGTVQFTVDEHRQWKIERLDLQYVQGSDGVKQLAPVP